MHFLLRDIHQFSDYKTRKRQKKFTVNFKIVSHGQKKNILMFKMLGLPYIWP